MATSRSSLRVSRRGCRLLRSAELLIARASCCARCAAPASSPPAPVGPLSSAEVQELGNKLLQAALALHDKVVSTFRKTAVNFHYE